MYGHKLAQTFLRTTEEPIAGDTKLTVEASASARGWRVGDRLLLPDTGSANGQRIEESHIQAIAGTVMTLTEPLAYNHLGARDVAGQLDLLPHVINMSRNIVIRSEYATLPEKLGYNPVLEGTRGHTMHFGRADVDIRYVSFQDLGRTKNTHSPINRDVPDLTIFEVDMFDSKENKTYTMEVASGKVRDVQHLVPYTYNFVVQHGRVVFKNGAHQVAPHIQQVGGWRLKQIGTNPLARYSVHTHHVSGLRRAPGFQGYQFQLVGNAIDAGGFGKWGLVIHGSHFGLIQHNIVYDLEGAAFVTEDGSETENVFEQNFALQTQFNSGSTASSKSGIAGDGFWFRGNNNYVRGNVSANNSSFGYSYFNQGPKGSTRIKHVAIGKLREQHIPLFRGAYVHDVTETDFIDGTTQVIRQFDDNENYAAHTSLNLWAVSMLQTRSPARTVDRDKRNVMSNTRLWHIRSTGIFTYGARNLTVDGFMFRGRATGIATTPHQLHHSGISHGVGIKADGVKVKDMIIRNADIQGVFTGIKVGTDLGGEPTIVGDPGSLVIENSYVRAHEGLKVSLGVRTGESNARERNIWIRDTTFDPLVPQGYQYHDADHEDVAIWTYYETPSQDIFATLLRKDNMYLENVKIFDGYDAAGQVRRNTIADGRLYFLEQAADHVMRQTFKTGLGKTVTASPEAGLTIQQNWDKYGIAIAGSVAPCKQTLNNVTGIICGATGGGGNQRPVARITTNVASGQSPLPIQFQGSGSFDGDGTIASYGWNFGDGTTGSGVTTTHTYTNAGTYTTTLTVIDNQGLAGYTTQAISVTAQNVAPDAVNDTATTRKATPVTINVLANDQDDDGDLLTIAGVSQGTHGAVTQTGTTVTYTPTGTFTGSDTFTYTITDGQDGRATGTVTVTVTAQNVAPDAVDDTASTLIATLLTLNVLANDVDANDDILSIASVTPPAHGTITHTSTIVTYTPDADFTGTDTFTYQAHDGVLDSASATVTITVTEREARISEGLVSLYTFDEGTGTTVQDVSGVAPLVDLEIVDPTAVTWKPGSLSVDAATIIQSDGTPIGLVHAMQATNELTMEAWITPTATSQNGPARIVTFSLDGAYRNFTLGQDGTRYQMRLRQTRSSLNGRPHLYTSYNSVHTGLTHVVFTQKANGVRTFYLDGVEVSSATVPSDFSNWAMIDHVFALAHEKDKVGARSWLGTYHLVALYDQALDAAEVQTNFTAGHKGTGNTPSNQAPVVAAISHDAIDVDTTTAGLQVNGGSTVTYISSATDPEHDPLTWEWLYSINGEAEILFLSGSGPIQPATWTSTTAPATYDWIIRVSDRAETSEQRLTVNVLTINALPVAHAGPDQHIQLASGQSQTSVTLDGSASTDTDGSLVAYRWTGTPDPGDVMSPQVTIGIGTHIFTLEVEDNFGTTATDTIIVHVQEAIIGREDILLSIEAEHAHSNIAQGHHRWVPVVSEEYAGGQALEASPNDGTTFSSWGYSRMSPQLDFQITFPQPGLYYVWLRAYGSNGTNDSAHVGFNGQENRASSAMQVQRGPLNWSGQTMHKRAATINVPSSGEHTVNVWMREDGVVLDKLILTTDETYEPTGPGPDETPLGPDSLMPPQ